MDDLSPMNVKLKSLAPYITCYLCKGYIIDATTISECLHTFCKSCLVKYFDENTTCPKCELLIHQSHPKNFISYDRTFQDIVYKLVPRLYEDEMKRRQDFYESRGLKFDDVIESSFAEHKKAREQELRREAELAANQTQMDVHKSSDYHRKDEQISLWLTCGSDELIQVHRAFVRCSTQATVTHLKKYIAKILFRDTKRFREIDVLCNDELMGKDHTLKFILKTRWRAKREPMALQYRRHIDI